MLKAVCVQLLLNPWNNYYFGTTKNHNMVQNVAAEVARKQLFLFFFVSLKYLIYCIVVTLWFTLEVKISFT